MKIRIKRYWEWAEKICKNEADSATQNDIWEKYVRRLLISGIFKRIAKRKSDKESSHVVGIIRNNTLVLTCQLLWFGGEPP